MTIDRAPAILALLSIAIMAGGCFTEKRAQKSFSKVVEQYPHIPAKHCADEYRTDTITVKGDSILSFDTIYVGGEIFNDTAFINDTVYVTEKYTNERVITKTVKITDTIYRENKAALDLCSIERGSAIRQLEKATEELKKVKAGNRNKLWIIIALSAVVVMLGYGRVKKLFKI